MPTWMKMVVVILVVGAVVLAVGAHDCGCLLASEPLKNVEFQPHRIPQCWLVCSACCNVGCYYTWRCSWCVLLGELPIGLWAGDLYECEDGTIECRNYGFRGCTCAVCAYSMAIPL